MEDTDNISTEHLENMLCSISLEVYKDGNLNTNVYYNSGDGLITLARLVNKIISSNFLLDEIAMLDVENPQDIVLLFKEIGRLLDAPLISPTEACKNHE